MRKKVLALILSLVLVFSVLYGCSSPSESEKEPSEPETEIAESEEEVSEPEESESETEDSDTNDEEVTVTVFCAYASEDPHGQYVYEYADKFMEENSNIKVEVTALSSNDIYTKLAAMATNPEDLPTLFYSSGDQAPSLYDLGMMEDLKKYLDDEYLNKFAPGVVEASSLDDDMVFYPIDLQPSAILYRTDWFEDAGLDVPESWDQFLEAAKALTVADDSGEGNDQWGFSMVGSNNSSGTGRFMAYLWSRGIDIVSYDENAGEWITDVDSDEFLEAFTFWTDLNNVHEVVPTGITEVDYATAANYFAMGYTGMMMSGGNALGVSYANNPDLVGKIGTFAIPGDYPGTMLNSEGYALGAHASDSEKEAAVKFLKFFAENDKDKKFWEVSGKLPSTIEGLDVDYLKGEDYAGFIAVVEEGGRPVLNFPGMNGLRSALGDAYSAVFSKEKTNEEAVLDLINDVEELFEDYN